jgi:hypothetical protein
MQFIMRLEDPVTEQIKIIDVDIVTIHDGTADSISKSSKCRDSKSLIAIFPRILLSLFLAISSWPEG